MDLAKILMDLLVSTIDNTATQTMYPCVCVYLMYVGQFFNAEVNIDTENMLMKFDKRNPILVRRDKVWPFLDIDAECWYAVDTNNQAARIIQGVYTDYIVDHLIPKAE